MGRTADNSRGISRRDISRGGNTIVEIKHRKGETTATQPPVERAFLVGVDLASEASDWSIDGSLAELAQLATTSGVVVVGQASQRMRAPNPALYVRKGKLEEIAALKEELGFQLVIFDDELSPTQQRNLEKELGVPVIDRTALILQIFAQRAHTREGSLQVELARSEYELPRVAGQWTHLERQAGGTGTRGGPGETQIEVDRRMLRRRISELKDEIEKIRKHRASYRERRQSAGIPVVALVGYTNAGKSTLLNTLTRAGVLSEDKLFATLDPTTRRFSLPTGQRVLISDTVGFIQKLPPGLVAAFRATLEELESADLLLHVVDVTHPNGFEQGQVVLKVLRELGLADPPIVTALNKIDQMTEGALTPDRIEATTPADLPEGARQILAQLAESYPNAVPISAARGWGLDSLASMIEATLARQSVEVTLRFPYTADPLIQAFRERARILDEKFEEHGVLLRGQVPQRHLARFADYIV